MKYFLINMNSQKLLTVPKNMKLIAVPLFELYQHEDKYGKIISNIPMLLSRFNFVYLQPETD